MEGARAMALAKIWFGGQLTYLLNYLVPPVPSGTSGDELSPSGTIVG